MSKLLCCSQVAFWLVTACLGNPMCSPFVTKEGVRADPANTPVKVGETVILDCAEGYSALADSEVMVGVVCLQNRTYDRNKQPECYKSCGKVTLVNGVFEPEDSIFPGQSVELLCDEGYVLYPDTPKLTCYESGYFYPEEMPVCVEKFITLDDIDCDPLTEEFHFCAPGCEPTCELPVFPFCVEDCIKNYCRCNDGKVRHKTGVCVNAEECHKIPPPPPGACASDQPEIVDGDIYFKPMCDEDGNYEALQCLRDESECWCVEKVRGFELQNSRRDMTAGGDPPC